ncbi:putative allophanate hydrolase subunit 1 [metagenome]|uniref:Putative allophanate hydrolase subunit 1 n=1 Tax=metagenome TaxID=256318 RepID=A0A2P2BWH9_9ZZZZ
MHLIPVGRDAILAEVADAGEALSLATWARGRVAAVEIVPAARTVLFDGVTGELDLSDWTPGPVTSGDLVTLAVDWNGPDFDHVAETWGRSVPEVMCSTEFTVAFCGFAPGFSYLTGLPRELALPRLASPRSRVPAGSLGLAGEYAGIYPTASPGGWQLVGTVEADLWDPTRSAPALLPPGTRVRLT